MKKYGGRPIASRKGKMKFIGNGRAIRTGRTTRRKTMKERGRRQKSLIPQRVMRKR
jgi:hypothetical protein